jgi:large subunit ribosomal protein L3
VTGFSKGKGFQGVVKRWGFHGGPDSHGSRRHRAPGSIGQCATPAKVWKNRKMAGHAGSRRITVRNLEIVQVDVDKNVIAIKGAVPGHPRSYVIVSGKA